MKTPDRKVYGLKCNCEIILYKEDRSKGIYMELRTLSKIQQE